MGSSDPAALATGFPFLSTQTPVSFHDGEGDNFKTGRGYFLFWFQLFHFHFILDKWFSQAPPRREHRYLRLSS